MLSCLRQRSKTHLMHVLLVLHVCWCSEPSFFRNPRPDQQNPNSRRLWVSCRSLMGEPQIWTYRSDGSVSLRDSLALQLTQLDAGFPCMPSSPPRWRKRLDKELQANPEYTWASFKKILTAAMRMKQLVQWFLFIHCIRYSYSSEWLIIKQDYLLFIRCQPPRWTQERRAWGRSVQLEPIARRILKYWSHRFDLF